MAVRASVENDQIVADLRDALRDGRSGLNYVPRLLGLVLEREAWRERYDETGELHPFASFDEFTAAPPMAGLGATPDLLDRVVGTKAENAEVRRKLRDARMVGKGHKRGLDSKPISKGEASDYDAGRLARIAPDEYEAVRRGDKTINAAARAAGIRPHRISVRLDRPESIARSLRRYMAPEQLSELARLLVAGG